MKILLTGADGFVGRNILKALESAGHIVKPASRKFGCDFMLMQREADWLPWLEEVEVVINAVGLIAETGGQRFSVLHCDAPCALFRAAKKSGVRRIIQISALGADHSAFTPYQQTKKAADDCLRSLDLNWFILQPSLICGKTGASTIQFMQLAAMPLIPLLGNGRQRLQPVHISDLVDTVLQCLSSDQSRQTIAVVGGREVSYAEYLGLMRTAQGKSKAMMLPVPFNLVLASACVGRFLVPIIHPDNLKMMQKGSFANAEPLARFLGRPPLSVSHHWFDTDDVPRPSTH